MILEQTYFDESIERCKKGDERAQLEIYRKYYKAMYNTALRIVKDVHEAEDIMQESFLNAFKKIDSYHGTATFGAWLKKIVVNRSINSLRKSNKNLESSFEDGIKYDRLDENHDGFDEELLAEEKIQQVLRTMSSLKENYRLILNLYLIEGYDHEEICGILKISNANCRTMISRAKESLRNKILNDGKR